MSLTFEILDIFDKRIDSELRPVIKQAFNSVTLPAGYLSANLNSGSSKSSFFIAAKYDNDIIGCNGFLANDFSVNGRSYVGYQCCWAAILPSYQGRGIFQAIINKAKEILERDGAVFLYGIPGNSSRRICLGKLGFKEIPTVSKRILNIPFLRFTHFTKMKTDTVGICSIDELQVQQHKVLQSMQVKIVTYNNSWVWGKLLFRKRMGIKILFFRVGGIHLDNDKDLSHLIKEIFRKNRVLFISIISSQTHTVVPLIKGWKKSKIGDLIFYPLNKPDFTHFNVMIGSIDVF